MKKGFTIIEILMVVVLIGLLSLLVIPNINKLLNNSTQALSKAQIRSIEAAASNFITDYYDYVKENDTFTVELKMLKDLSYIEMEIKNAKTNKFFSDNSLITYTKDNDQYKATFYGVDSDNISSSVEYLKHIVLLKGENIFTGSAVADENNVILMSSTGKKYQAIDFSLEALVESTNSDGTKNVVYNITLIEEAVQYDFSITRKESIN